MNQAAAHDWTTELWPYSLYCEWKRRLEGEFEEEELASP